MRKEGMKIRAILRFRNEDLTRKRLIAGFKTQKQLAIYLGISQITISQWETFKNYPKTKKVTEALETALNCEIDEIFPPEFIKIIKEKTLTALERVVDVKQLPEYTRGEFLLPDPEAAYELKEITKSIEECFKLLTEREVKVLKLRFGLAEYKGYEHILEEIGDIIKISRSRVMQIEYKALRKLRHPSHNKLLKQFI